jgi:hypothetical protein
MAPWRALAVSSTCSARATVEGQARAPCYAILLLDSLNFSSVCTMIAVFVLIFVMVFDKMQIRRW